MLYLQVNSDTRLIVLTCCRPLVFHLTHTIPWAGHLGQQKTYTCIISRFHWSSLCTDVKTHCDTCATCQNTRAVSQQGRAPLYPLPVISTPYLHSASPWTLWDHLRGAVQAINTSWLYVTTRPDIRKPFPLCFITTPKIIQGLIQLFSRVVLPEEILTDRGRSLVERFNQTLKSMLQKFVSDTGRDWDKWLPFLLFNRVLTFELLYGWQVQAPLDLLKKSWEGPAGRGEKKGIIQYVLEMRDRLDLYQEQARENLKEAQKAHVV